MPVMSGTASSPWRARRRVAGSRRRRSRWRRSSAKPRSIAYLTSAGGDVAVDGRAEPDTVPDVDGDRPPAGETTGMCDARSGTAADARRLVGEQRTLRRVRDLVRERVVRLARVDVVDVTCRQDGDGAAHCPAWTLPPRRLSLARGDDGPVSRASPASRPSAGEAGDGHGRGWTWCSSSSCGRSCGLGVEGVADAVAEQVEREHGEQQRNAREDEEPPGGREDRAWPRRASRPSSPAAG